MSSGFRIKNEMTIIALRGRNVRKMRILFLIVNQIKTQFSLTCLCFNKVRLATRSFCCHYVYIWCGPPTHHLLLRRFGSFRFPSPSRFGRQCWHNGKPRMWDYRRTGGDAAATTKRRVYGSVAVSGDAARGRSALKDNPSPVTGIFTPVLPRFGSKRNADFKLHDNYIFFSYRRRKEMLGLGQYVPRRRLWKG